MKFFKKSNPGNKIIGRDGKPIPFERLADGSLGIISADEDKQDRLIEALMSYVDKKLGGVTEITKEEYEELKKNPQYQPSRESLNPRLALFDATGSGLPGQLPTVLSPPVAQPATVQVDVSPAAASSRAGRAKAPATSQGDARTKPRLARLNPPDSLTKPPAG